MTTMMLTLWWYITYYLRPIIKWFLRKTTGLCELQRICYGQLNNSTRTINIEYSLEMSHSMEMKRLIKLLDEISAKQQFNGPHRQEYINGALGTIVQVKRINPLLHPQFVANMDECIACIWLYRQLCAEVEHLRRVAYDANEATHEARLYELWAMLMPDCRLLGRITKQWQEIGFQGDDPRTDFRGMGLLGLDNLVYFARNYKDAAQHVLSHSQHPIYGYAFAIVGINLTCMAWNLLNEGVAKHYFYHTIEEYTNSNLIDVFHQFYCYLFYEFDRYWIECKPKNIMEFSHIKDTFEMNIRLGLNDPNGIFKINVSVDTV